MNDSVKFGTSGLRGLARDLEAGAAYRHAVAFCARLRQSPGHNGALFLGRDRRESSLRLAQICASAAEAAGLLAVDCGALPTPALAQHAMAQAAGAIMITGSHIPADRNGLKFYVPGGEITKDDELAISTAAASADASATNRTAAKSDRGAASERFSRRYRGFAQSLRLSGRRIGVWAHSSVAAELLGELVGLSGAEAVVFGATDTFVPVDTEALSGETRDLLAHEAETRRLDAIVSADADGDRPLVADETGRQLPGDLIAFAAAVAGGAEAIALPVTCNGAIENGFSGRIARTKIGSPYVLAALAQFRAEGANAIAGFEANGGLMTAGPLRLGGAQFDALPTRDSFLPILATLARLADPSRRLGDMAREFGFRPAAADRLANYDAADSGRLVGELVASGEMRRAFAGFGGEAKLGDRTDGVALLGSAGEVVRVRASGNAPELRIYVEAATSASAERLLAHCLQQAEAFRSNGARAR